MDMHGVCVVCVVYMYVCVCMRVVCVCVVYICMCVRGVCMYDMCAWCMYVWCMCDVCVCLCVCVYLHVCMRGVCARVMYVCVCARVCRYTPKVNRTRESQLFCDLTEWWQSSYQQPWANSESLSKSSLGRVIKSNHPNFIQVCVCVCVCVCERVVCVRGVWRLLCV